MGRVEVAARTSGSFSGISGVSAERGKGFGDLVSACTVGVRFQRSAPYSQRALLVLDFIHQTSPPSEPRLKGAIFMSVTVEK